MKKVIFIESNNSYLITNDELINKINESIISDLYTNPNDVLYNRYIYIDIIGNFNSVLIYFNDDVYVIGVKQNSIDCLFNINDVIKFITSINDRYKLIIRNSNVILKYFNDVEMIDRILDYDCYIHYLNNTFTLNKIKDFFVDVNKEINHIHRLHSNITYDTLYSILNINKLIDLSINMYDLIVEYISKNDIPKTHVNMFDKCVSNFNYLNKLTVNGIFDKNEIKSIQYHINSISKRPTLIGGNNYLGMNKSSGVRKDITSRYENGYIVEIDFQSYHLQLIDRFLNLFNDEKLELTKNNIDINSFNYMNEVSKIVFNKEIESKEDRDLVKQQIFYLLYNNINHIDNVKINKLNEFKDKLKSYYDKNKRIKSIKSKGYIYFDDTINYNKLINYLIQDLESNTNFEILRDMYIKFNMSNKYDLILYIYDSFIFDIKDDLKLSEFIDEISEVLNGYIYRIKIGKDYDDMKIYNQINNSF